MPPIVAPGVCRFAINGTYSGQPTVNIVDMRIDTTGSVANRAESCYAQAGILVNQWAADVMPNLSSLATFTSVSWVDLDDLAGSTGERSSTDTVTLPVSGTGGSYGVAGNVAYRVGKATVPTRGQRQGRMYIAGVTEEAMSNSNPNTVDPTWSPAFQTDLSAFLDNINQEDDASPTAYTSYMVVVHTLDGVYESSTEVQDLTLNARFGSQRRRLNLN